ncbi:MBL fold metallo-hydrolase [Paenibacillus sp. GD4]|uniref:MBL fold metallo-hydrolase n=1 Tax=Paenibacillus sp. GD4 TaxID=3068890 RepID=UPI0027969864|nr:MBL fold metallo-hydrolase [Paenibacillus sp. GD4]MDQ1912817.1 MBL fold metallo-hydrolase [Paenibacillus sp. GD4]
MENSFEDVVLPVTSVTSGEIQEAAQGIHCLPVQIVNVVFADNGSEGWVLIDAGMPRSAEAILREAEDRYGSMKPEAIVLTHGHFDHVGAVVDLVEHWQVPVYAHELELLYLTGERDYPPADPAVDEGWIAKLSPLFPNAGIDLKPHVRPLPADGTVPGLKGWRWIHTPGHTPGHVSLFRETDRCLVAGDAFVTVKQESLYQVVLQELELNGPPKYFTTDWSAAWESVKKLASLQPAVAVTGHGRPIRGEELNRALGELAERFDELAIPSEGRFVH